MTVPVNGNSGIMALPGRTGGPSSGHFCQQGRYSIVLQTIILQAQERQARSCAVFDDTWNKSGQTACGALQNSWQQDRRELWKHR